MTWEEVCAQRSLWKLPFRIETNRWGQIVLSRLHNDRSFARAAIEDLLAERRLSGYHRQQTLIETEDGTKVADVTWMSEAFYKAHKGQSSFKEAPEICVEVKSPSNTMGELLEKKDLYFKAGAREVWIWEGSGTMLFFNADGPMERSALCPTFPKTVEI